MEYQTFAWDEYMDISLDEKLNNIAEEGWTIVSVVTRTSGFLWVICERRKE